MDYLGATLEIKAVQAQQRIISGLAAGIGNQDRVQDVILPGAFRKTLAARTPADVAVFIGHKQDSLPVGIPLKIEETPHGLYTETLIKPGPAGDDLLATAEFLARHGRALGMSIGYRVPTGGAKMARGLDGKMVRHLAEVDLHEYSFAASQSIANPAALVMGVKAMKYRIEQRGAEFVVLDADGEEEGTYPTRAAAEAEMARLMREGDEPETPGNAGKQADDADDYEHKAVWDTAYVNNLPDSAFLFVEPGGQKDDAGKTVPRTKRHFPVRDAAGALDAAHVRNAIARIPQSDAPGLDKAALQGRARRLLANAEGGSKTLDGDSPEWRAGVNPQLVHWAHVILAVADRNADGHKAMAYLGEDTHDGQVIRPDECATLREAERALKALTDVAETINAGRYGAARSARWARELELVELGA